MQSIGKIQSINTLGRIPYVGGEEKEWGLPWSLTKVKKVFETTDFACSGKSLQQIDLNPLGDRLFLSWHSPPPSSGGIKQFALPFSCDLASFTQEAHLFNGSGITLFYFSNNGQRLMMFRTDLYRRTYHGHTTTRGNHYYELYSLSSGYDLQTELTLITQSSIGYGGSSGRGFLDYHIGDGTEGIGFGGYNTRFDGATMRYCSSLEEAWGFFPNTDGDYSFNIKNITIPPTGYGTTSFGASSFKIDSIGRNLFILWGGSYKGFVAHYFLATPYDFRTAEQVGAFRLPNTSYSEGNYVSMTMPANGYFFLVGVQSSQMIRVYRLYNPPPEAAE